jgi:hypothetical protein
MLDEEHDEFAGYFKEGTTPKIVITTNHTATKVSIVQLLSNYFYSIFHFSRFL